MSDDWKWTTSTHVTPFTLTSKAELTSMVLETFLFCSFISFPVPPVHPHFNPMVFTRLCIKLYLWSKCHVYRHRAKSNITVSIPKATGRDLYRVDGASEGCSYGGEDVSSNSLLCLLGFLNHPTGLHGEINVGNSCD